MKNNNIFIFISTLILFVVATVSYANDDKYTQAMLKNITVVYTAQSIEALQDAVNAFERIGGVEKAKWEPHYYAAFGYIMMATREQDGIKKDQYLDQAMASIRKARVLVPEESEVITLEGFVNMLRLTVDPASRGPQYAPVATQLFNHAIALNPENPRAIALLAQMQFGAAQFFGSSTAEACATIDKALERFATFKPVHPLMPQWGKGMAESLKGKCQ